MPGGDVTLGELSRRLDSLEGRITGQFGQIMRSIDNLQYVHRETYQAQMAALLDRIEDLEEAKRWSVRALAVSLVMPVLVAIVVAMAVAR